MSMGIGINAQSPDAGQIRGLQEPVACGVWFTSSGTVMPKFLKFCGDDGEIRLLSGIHVIRAQKQNYCGIPTFEYECDAEFEGCCYHFYLLYYIERQEWKILWKNRQPGS